MAKEGASLPQVYFKIQSEIAFFGPFSNKIRGDRFGDPNKIDPK